MNRIVTNMYLLFIVMEQACDVVPFTRLTAYFCFLNIFLAVGSLIVSPIAEEGQWIN